MGAWGYGLLQNDSSQDGLCDIHDRIEADVGKLARRRPGEAMAARLAGGIGLLLHLNAHYSFNSENAFFGQLDAALARQEPAFDTLPRKAATILRNLRANPEKGADLVDRTGPLDKQLQVGFFNKGKGFPMERRMGKREPALFEHPGSAAYVQEVADRCLRVVVAGFRKRGILRDLCREGGDIIAALATLFVIEPCAINPARLRDCWELYRAAAVGANYEDEEDFQNAYRACLRAALTAGIRKFSAGAETLPLEE
jgi:hypothetical protein